MTKGIPRVLAASALALGAAVALGAAIPAQAAGEQIVVDVPEAFEIDGRVFPAGPLAVRHLGAYTPTTAMVLVTAGRECVGILLARKDKSTIAPTGSAVVFERSGDGRLTLAGFTLPGRRSQSFYAYGNRDRRDRIADGAELLVASR